MQTHFLEEPSGLQVINRRDAVEKEVMFGALEQNTKASETSEVTSTAKPCWPGGGEQTPTQIMALERACNWGDPRSPAVFQIRVLPQLSSMTECA